MYCLYRLVCLFSVFIRFLDVYFLTVHIRNFVLQTQLAVLVKTSIVLQLVSMVQASTFPSCFLTRI